MSYLMQMAGLTVHNSCRRPTGIALAVARSGFRPGARRRPSVNFWVDLDPHHCSTRWLPLFDRRPACYLSFWPKVMRRTFTPTSRATSLEGGKQVIAHGPVASQEVIQDAGHHGGGFFNTNSAHPYENPTHSATSCRALADLRCWMPPDQRSHPAWSATSRQGWASAATASGVRVSRASSTPRRNGIASSGPSAVA